MLPGQRIVGNSVSFTVTLKLQEAVLPLASVRAGDRRLAVAKVLPLPDARDGRTRAVVADRCDIADIRRALAGIGADRHVRRQDATGASVSLTVTLKLHALVLPLASVAVQETEVVPLANVLPLAGTHAIVAPGQLSLTDALKLTSAVHLPASVLTVMSLGQVATGDSLSATVTLKVQLAVLPLSSLRCR